MATLNREQYFEKLRAILGDRSDPESIQALEDLTDTYNSMEQGAKGDGIDWEKKFRDNDKAWAERYRNRFMYGDGGSGPKSKQDLPTDGYKPEDVDFDDLFK